MKRTIYAGTIGSNRHYYTDQKDALPPEIRDDHEFESEASLRDEQFRAAIREAEVDGMEICWLVGDEYYETSRTDLPTFEG